jgi:pyruvate carboxylase subunit B
VKYHVRIGDAKHVVEIGDGLTLDGAPVAATIYQAAGSPLLIATVDGVQYRLQLRSSERGEHAISLEGYLFKVEALDERTLAIRELGGRGAVASGPAPVLAPMPGLIVRVSVAPGDHVTAGQGVVVMEAMKMENELRATAAGVVKAVHVAPGTAVEKGAPLVELE